MGSIASNPLEAVWNRGYAVVQRHQTHPFLLVATGVIAVAVFAAAQAHATILVEETFSYPDGNLTNSSPWTVFGGTIGALNVSNGQAFVTGQGLAN